MAKEKLTKKLIEQAVELKSSGLSDCDIAAAIGVTKGTFSKWMCHPETKLQAALSERIKKEESAYKEALLNTIRAAALAKNSNWTAAAWLLERKYPDEYSQNRQLANAEAERAPQIVLGVNVGIARGYTSAFTRRGLFVLAVLRDDFASQVAIASTMQVGNTLVNERHCLRCVKDVHRVFEANPQHF